MKLLERLRNCVEVSPAISRLYASVGSLSIWRKLIMNQLERRIEHVRCNKTYSVVLETSSICNARCVFCPHQDMKREKIVMPDSVFHTALRRIMDERINPPFIDLFDIGEPLIDRVIFDRVRQVKKHFPSSLVRFTTNFNLANDTVINDLLSSGLDSLHISINAARPETYLKIMQLDYYQTVGNIERLLERCKALNSPLNICVSMVISQENRGEEKEFIRQWGNRVNNVFIQRASDWGGGVKVESQYPTGQTLYPCIDLFERIVILSNGDYALCCQDYEGGTGKNVIRDGILETFYSEPFVYLREKHLGNGIKMRMCANCFGTHGNGITWVLKNFSQRYTI